MNRRQKGFTIVEMIIVVILIAILALFTVFAFNNYRTRAARTEMRNEVLQSAAALKNYENFNNIFPADQAGFDPIYSAGSNVTLTYTSPSSLGVHYCVAATSVNDTAETFYINDVISQPTTTKPTYCP